MIELTSRELQIKFNNQVIKLRYPTVRDSKLLSDELKKEGNEIDGLVNFLNKLGMDMNIAESLEIDHLNMIVKELTGAKKQ